jgi:hypothetical protein
MPNVQGFIQQYAPVAASVGQRIGVAPDVLLGQWGLETGWGKSVVPGTNNLGNIKGPGVAATDNQTGANDQYRAYSSPQAFGSDFADLISRKYQGALGTGSDAAAYGNALQSGGYAVDSKYANKLAGAVGMVRKFGDAIASAISGSANASELSPQQMSGAPVISATGQQIMPQATKQPGPAAPTSSAPASTGDPLLDMAHGVMAGSTAASPAPSATSASAQPAQAADDPLLAMANSVLSAKSAAPTPAAANPGGNPVPPPTGEQPGALASFGAGLGHGVQNTVLGAQQLLGHGLTSLGSDTVGPWLTKDAEQGIARGNADYAPYSDAHPVAAGAGNIAGNVAATAPLALVAPELAGAGLATRVGAGAALGAASNALTPVTDLAPGQTFAGEKAKQIGLGAVTGGIATPLVAAIGRTVSPVIGAAQQKLLDAGVPLTPGQIMGGAAARTEAKLTSIPFLGDMIKNSQQRAVQGFNKATYNEVLAPLGQKYDGPIGSEGVAAVKKTISDAYDSALSRMTFRATDPQFQSDITNLGNLAQKLPAQQQQTFMNVLNTQVFGKLSPQGQMDGQALKGVQEELGDLARGYAGDPSFDNRQLGAAIGEIKSAIDSSLPRYNAPDAVQDLTNANAAYANYVRLRGAAGSQGAMNNGGVFTAAQLNSAVRAADKSAGKGATATGNALMQDFSTAGQDVLGSKYPDSGTPGRALLALMGPAALGQTFAPGYTTPLAAALGVGSLPYTALGQRAAQAVLTARPAIAAPIGNGIVRFGAPLAAPAANAMTQAIGHPQK